MEFDDDYLEQKLYEIPPDMLEGSVDLLRNALPESLKEFLRKAYHSRKPNEWWFSPYHFSLGMSMRNALRDAGFLDRKLPDKNWDDYYVKVLEIAIGVKENPMKVKGE